VLEQVRIRKWNWIGHVLRSDDSITNQVHIVRMQRTRATQVRFVYGWQVKLCDPLVTHGPYLSTSEMYIIKCCYKFTFFTLPFLPEKEICRKKCEQQA